MDKKEVLLTLARGAIAEAFGRKRLGKKAILRAHPWLAKPGAAFVTLNRRENGALRGCIGSLVAHQSLYEDIVKNAQSAASSDPRFPALRPEEFDKITVEVSILSEPKPLPYTSVDDLRSKIRPGVDGVILKLGGYQATYLPQVWEQLPNFDAFFASLCQKAGLPGVCLSQHPEILVYQVEEYHE